MVVTRFPASPPHHHRKRARVVFDGSYLFSGINTQPPSKTSIRACFRWRLLVFWHHHPTTIKNEQCVLVFDGGYLFHPTTIENEHLCSLLVVITCFPASAPHLH